MAITINNTPPRKQYTASSGQVNFAGVWRIEEDTDIKVYLTPVGSSPDDTADILILTTDYTVTGAGTSSFTVTLNVGATTGDIISILDDINFGAEYNFLTNQNFDPADFNVIFSKFDRELKQLRMETRKLQPKYQNSSQVIAKDYKLPQLGALQSWRMGALNSEIEAVIIGDTGPGEQWYGVTTGVNTYLSTITDFIGYTTGETIYLNIGSSNTLASTININGLGGKNLLRNDGTPLNSGDLAATKTYVFIYHSGQYYLLGQQRATESSVGISQIATTAEVATGTDDFKYVTPKKLTEKTEDGLAKAWVSFDGNGAVVVKDSYNLQSVVRNGVGDYTITWSVNFAIGEWSESVSTKSPLVAAPDNTAIIYPIGKSINSIQIECVDTNDAKKDSAEVSIIAFGTLV